MFFDKKLSLHKKFWSIYRKVLSVTWPNFTVVKYNSKISIIYHQIKFWKGIMNRSLWTGEYRKIFKSTCFEEHLWTAVWTFSSISQWRNKQNRNWRRYFLKNKIKKTIQSLASLPFHDALGHFVFLYISTACLRRRLPYIIKDDSSERL